MAFQLKFTANLGSDCKSIIILDTTGDYNAVTNPTGWGTPNPEKADVASAYISIINLTTNTTYDNITEVSDYTTGSVTIYTSELLIDGVSIGDVTLPDGQYCILLSLTMNDDSVYQQTVKKVFLCESCCKIKTKACEIDLQCGCCNEPCAKEIWAFLQAFAELKIVEYSAYCGSTSNINKKIKSLQSLLSTFDCPNC